jgi:hypothetical protein
MTNQVPPTRFSNQDQLVMPYTFLHGVAQSRNVGRVIAQFQELAQDGSNSSLLMMWTLKKKQQWHHFNVGWTAIRILTTKTQMLVLGEGGELFTADATGTKTSKIGDTDLEFRDMAMIAGCLYAVGIGRQVYRREAPGNWIREDKGIEVGSTDTGFNSIHGLDATNTFAVGLGGEIWQLSEGSWRKLESPTSANLNCVRVIEPGLAYATGENGTLLHWDGKQWASIENNSLTCSFWGLEMFKGGLYIATDDGLFSLNPDKTLKKIFITHDVQLPCKHLSTNDGVLWSVGPHCVAWTEDARLWRDVTPGVTAVESDVQDNNDQNDSCSCGHTGSSMHTGGAIKCE